MQKIIDGLLFDTEKADLICAFKIDMYFGADNNLTDDEYSIFRKLRMVHEDSVVYFDLCFVFQTNKGAYFTVVLNDEYEEAKEYIKSLNINTHISFETFVSNLLERFVHLELMWSQLTEKQARKLCEGHLSVSDYMKIFSVEEA